MGKYDRTIDPISHTMCVQCTLFQSNSAKIWQNALKGWIHMYVHTDVQILLFDTRHTSKKPIFILNNLNTFLDILNFVHHKRDFF